MAKHRMRITLEYDSPITDELMDIWSESFFPDGPDGRGVYEGVRSVKVTDVSLSDADEERLRGQAEAARGNVRPRSRLKSAP